MEPFRIRLPARLGAGSIADLERALRDAAAADARVWVLEGAGSGVFCEGMDLGSVAGEQARGREAVEGFGRCLRALVRAPRPTIAIVDGDALGGGLGIAAAADLTIASSRANVGLPEALFGILPAMIMPVLLTRMSQQNTRLLALSGSSRDAEWAARAGLFDRVVGPEALASATRRAQRDLSRVAPAVVSRLRVLVSEGSSRELDAALDHGVETAAATLADAEVRRTVTRFVEEGVAPWVS